ncbi:MAG TPA: chemotaxis protein CheX [Candidatus Sulfotelmatobacter sp.]|jgi:chemotaxis protein CheX|nr:chemotaxis protein CheX [Candidatus Sulfotelmatobacter sp.]
MSQTLQLPNIAKFMSAHLVDVFETMLSMKAVPKHGEPMPHFASRVTGAVGFAGDTVNGAVYLHLSAPFAVKVAATMLGIAPEEISGESDVNDVVGEATNMVTGGLKSWLCDNNAPCAMSTPAIIRGTAFSIEPMPDVERDWLVFQCDDEFVIVEIHIKLN